jgi:hypothetical protein
MAQDSALGLYFKTLRTHNLLEIDRFGNKLAYNELDKLTRFNKETNQLSTESVHYESIMFYSTDPWDITKHLKINFLVLFLLF